MSEPQLSEGVLVGDEKEILGSTMAEASRPEIVEAEEWKSGGLPVIPLPPLPRFHTAEFLNGVLSFICTFFGGLLVLTAFRFLSMIH